MNPYGATVARPRRRRIPIFSGSRSRAFSLRTPMPYKFLRPSSLDPPKTLTPKPTTTHALAERISPPSPRFAATPDAGEPSLPLPAPARWAEPD